MITAEKTEFTKNDEVLYNLFDEGVFLTRKSLEFVEEQKADLENQLAIVNAKIAAINLVK